MSRGYLPDLAGFAAVLWSLAQGLATLVLVEDEVKSEICDIDVANAVFVALAAAAFVLACVGFAMQARGSAVGGLRVVAASAVTSVAWALVGGWGSTGCVIGV